jgi:hypothetical protein
LIENESTRIPKDDIEGLINELEKDTVTSWVLLSLSRRNLIYH